MPESNILTEQGIEIDKVTDGKLRLVCRWNVTTENRENADGTTTTVYVYDESIINWTLPAQYIPPLGTVTQITTAEDIKNYVTSAAEEIMSFAKASKIALVPDVSNKSVHYIVPIHKNYPNLFTTALQTYNTAVSGYVAALENYNTALAAYTAAGMPVTSGNAVAHIQPLANAMQALAAENAAFALAIPAVVNVLKVLAQKQDITE